LGEYIHIFVEILLRELIFIEDFSHNALPKLLKNHTKVDFALIDGDHRFDFIFIDFYYIDLLLNQKGYVLFHDFWMPSTKTIISWIKNNKKDYHEIKTPIKSFVLFQKRGKYNRDWQHFIPFGKDIKKEIKASPKSRIRKIRNRIKFLGRPPPAYNP